MVTFHTCGFHGFFRYLLNTHLLVMGLTTIAALSAICCVFSTLPFITHDMCKFVSHRVVFVHSIDLFVHFQLSFVGQEAESIPGIIGSKYGKVVKILDLSYNQLRWL